ncbi:hypothetical protein ig2599ANME_0126 [groundwater metagenome]
MKNPENEIIEYFIDACKKELGENLVSIVSFGSFPKGTATSSSDMDFLIVVNEKISDHLMKTIRKDVIFKFNKKIDTVSMTERDVIDNFKSFSPLFCSFILGIKILHDRDGFFKEQFKNFINELRKTNIKYCEKNKIWDLREISSRISL